MNLQWKWQVIYLARIYTNIALVCVQLLKTAQAVRKAGEDNTRILLDILSNHDQVSLHGLFACYVHHRMLLANLLMFTMQDTQRTYSKRRRSDLNFAANVSICIRILNAYCG